MKRKLLKVTLALMTTAWVGGVQAQEFDGQAYVSTETTWIFDGETVSETETTGVNQTSQNTGLYNRSKSSGCGFTFAAVDGGQHLTFSDGYQVTVNKVAKTKATGANFDYLKEIYAGTSGKKTFNDTKTVSNYAFPYFAFNASVAGTCYAYVKAGTKSSSAKKMRIQFYKGDGTETDKKNGDGTETTDLVEMKCTSTVAGVFFIGSTSAGLDTDCEIYAIRFVPSDVKKTIYIGATGYATFGNNTGSNLDIPFGLTAYAAKPETNSVTLTALEGIPQTAGVVLKGTPNTNYSFKASATTYSVSNNYMKRVTADATLAQTETEGSKTYYNYILANDNGTPKFFLVDGTSTIAKDKAYLRSDKQFTPPAGAGSRGVSIIFADEATGIEAVTTQQGDGQWYNLQGQKVAQPAKGLFIKNGKKVIIK